MKRSELLLGVLRVPLDYCMAVGALVVAYFLRSRLNVSYLNQIDPLSFPAFNEYIKFALIGAGVFVSVLMLYGCYSLNRPRSFSAEIKNILFSSVVWLMVVISYYFFIRDFPFSRLVLLLAVIFMSVFVSAGRTALRVLRRLLLKFGIGKRRIVIIGTNSSANKLEDFVNNTAAFSLVACVRSFDELLKKIPDSNDFDEIFHSHSNKDDATRLIDFCREHQREYHFVPDVLELHRSGFTLMNVGGVPLITLNPTPLEGWRKVLKRGFDVISSLLGLSILSPIFVVIAILIKLESKGTVFFRHLDDGRKAMRVGERGDLFCCLKFRTMKMNTHNMRYAELAENNTRKNSPLVKIKNDPRVTKVGKILRQYSLDELPQLWNVLIGEMSLVGPRPHLPEEVAKYEKHHKFVLTLKPGITGLAQINGRSDLDFEQEVNHDTFYIENWSLWLDIKILLKTVVVVLKPYKDR